MQPADGPLLGKRETKHARGTGNMTFYLLSVIFVKSELALGRGMGLLFFVHKRRPLVL